MYSPKISEDLIPILYITAKINKKSMTKIVDSILREHLLRISTDPPANPSNASYN